MKREQKRGQMVPLREVPKRSRKINLKTDVPLETEEQEAQHNSLGFGTSSSSKKKKKIYSYLAISYIS